MKKFQSLVLVFASLTGSAFSAVSYTTDTTSSLVGSFSLDTIVSSGTGSTIASFPHFHFDLIDNDGYPTGGAQFFVALDTSGASPTIILQGEDLSSFIPSATRSYDATGVPASYPDFRGSYSSPFDAQTISYSYTNVGFTGNTVTGDFSFNVVPEPSTAFLALLGLTFGYRRRR